MEMPTPPSDHIPLGGVVSQLGPEIPGTDYLQGKC
jgi:hypothetical protein